MVDPELFPTIEVWAHWQLPEKVGFDQCSIIKHSDREIDDWDCQLSDISCLMFISKSLPR
jgi:hypothetical protein